MKSAIVLTVIFGSSLLTRYESLMVLPSLIKLFTSVRSHFRDRTLK